MDVDRWDWDEENWGALTTAIHLQQCILFLGPDAALERVSGDEYRPLTQILANELAKDSRADLEKWGIDTFDLTQVSLCFHLKYDRNQLLDRVRSFYEKRLNLTSPLHENLASLPFPLIVTSTFDSMFLNALNRVSAHQKREARVDFHDFKGPKRERMEMGTKENPLIYHLYGSLGNLRSLVITENDLLELLTRVASGDAPLPGNLVSELNSEDKSLLFLGFGFRHWYLRILLHVLRMRTKSNRSFALEKFESRYLPDIGIMTLIIQNRNCKIQIWKADLLEFTEKLKNEYKQRYPQEDLIAQPLKLAPRPTVFISYARENAEEARTLESKLKGFVTTKLDQEFLELGDGWEQKIEESISTADYFIFLQSQELYRQYETYAFRELDLARKRQQKFRPGAKFIIPVSLGDCPIPSQLKDLHVDTISLNESGSIDKVVSVIERDFKLRQRDGLAA